MILKGQIRHPIITKYQIKHPINILNRYFGRHNSILKTQRTFTSIIECNTSGMAADLETIMVLFHYRVVQTTTIKSLHRL